MNATQLILVRHGQTAFNEQGRIQGHLDEPLNDSGLRQAQQLVAGLQQLTLNAIYCSDLIRTRQTLAPYADQSKLGVSYLPGLRERHFGQFEGLTRAQVVAHNDPDSAARFESRDPDFDLGGGESMRRFYHRSIEALKGITLSHPGQVVLVVTHGGVLDCVQRWARGLALNQPRDFQILNASINQVSVQGNACQIDVWADVRHLDQA